MRNWLSRPAARWWIVGLALVLCAAALPSGLVLDDHFHAVLSRGEPDDIGPNLAPWDLFAFADNPEAVTQMIEDGIFPWWSDLQARYSFFRPLSSLTIWLDHQLWPEAPALMHAHSLLWYGLLLAVVARVYRRFSSSSVFAALALAIFALDDARSMTVGWLANRGALIALATGFLALLAHDSWRTSGRKRWLAASLLALGAGLAGAEMALQVVGYLVAYALFLDAGEKRERLWSLAPYAFLVVAWRAIYAGLGYGAARTDLYIDPGRDPVRFARAAIGRIPVLFGAQFVGISSDLADMLHYVEPVLGRLILPLCVLCVAALAWLIVPLWRAQRSVRFWATGTVLSTIPVCAVAPADRLLTATALGGSALIASLLLAVADRVEGYRRAVAVSAAVGLAIVHLVLGPLLLPLRSFSLIYLDRYIARAEKTAPSGPEIAKKTLVFLNPPTDEYGVYVPLRRQAQGGPMPKRIRWLATGENDLLLARVDRFSLKIRPRLGFLPPGSIWTLRSPQKRSFVGETLTLSGTTYRITDLTADGRPAEVVVRFDAPLDSDEFVWLRWGEEGGYVPFVVPDPGMSVSVPAIDPRTVFTGL